MPVNKLQVLDEIVDACELEMAKIEIEIRNQLKSSSSAIISCAASSSQPVVRWIAWSLDNWAPTLQQVALGIQDDEVKVRLAVWENKNWMPTSDFLKNRPEEADPEVTKQIMEKEREFLKTRRQVETKDEAIKRISIETL